MYTVIDLFCGCGGLSWGFSKAGFTVLAGIDQWQPALTTFALNHPEAETINANLASLSPHTIMQRLGLVAGSLDCLIGGPPCQGFSKNVPAVYRYLDDPQNQLFKVFLEWIEVLKPKTVLIENVAEMYNAFEGRIRNEITAGITALGYQVEIKTLLAADYGVPQRRRRCFIMATRTGHYPRFPDPTHSTQGTLFTPPHWSAWSAISDLPRLENGEGYEPMPHDQIPQNEYQSCMRRDADNLHDHITRPLAPKQLERVRALQPGQGLKDLPAYLQTKGGYSGAYGRLDFEMVAPTITRWVFHPGSGRFCHPREARLITIREAARLQSFSDDFRFTGSYIDKSHQVGNAVPPLLGAAFATQFKSYLKPALAELPHLATVTE